MNPQDPRYRHIEPGDAGKLNHSTRKMLIDRGWIIHIRSGFLANLADVVYAKTALEAYIYELERMYRRPPDNGGYL